MISHRAAVLDDAAALAELHVRCWREAYAGLLPPPLIASFSVEQKTAQWRSMLESGQNRALGAYDNGVPVGLVIFGANTEKDFPLIDGQIAALYVLKSHHGTGLGRALMAEAARQWIGQGGHSMLLGVLEGNERAIAFYRKQGGQLVRNTHYEWGGYQLPHAIYVFSNLEELASFHVPAVADDQLLPGQGIGGGPR